MLYRFNRKGDQHLISPYNNTKFFIKIMRIKEMIANLRNLSLNW